MGYQHRYLIRTGIVPFFPLSLCLLGRRLFLGWRFYLGGERRRLEFMSPLRQRPASDPRDRTVFAGQGCKPTGKRNALLVLILTWPTSVLHGIVSSVQKL